MEVAHLDHILDRLPDRTENVYGKGTERTAMGNYIAAARSLEIPHRVDRDESNRRYLRLFRQDGSHLDDVAPALLPGCSKSTRRICNDKIVTSAALARAGIRTPSTEIYGAEDEDRAYKMAFRASGQVVIKAHALTLGRGVFLNVTKENFREHFRACLNLQKRSPEPRILVQEMVQGFEMRATVIEGALDNVLVRIPAYVTGDGKSTVDELIDAKNARRAKCEFFGKKPIVRDHNLLSYMQAYRIDGNAIPSPRENVLVSSISNAFYGGETAIVTEQVSSDIKDAALRAVAAIPGLRTAGVDIMAESFDSSSPLVIELNSFPHAQLSIYPYFGEGTNPLRRLLRAIYAEDSARRGAFDEIAPEDYQFISGYLDFYRLRDRISPA